ncbi:hypothetical protein DAMA08_042020 [Martiniozyma asiatica (nom. inval.)]|nr:hypothetical protein DAMA08_042020 [Martiniozyma asiatica]
MSSTTKLMSSVFSNRPIEVFRYSKKGGELSSVTFDYSGLAKLSIPRNYTPPKLTPQFFRQWDVRKGSRKFKHYVFAKDISRIDLLLKSVVSYESTISKGTEIDSLTDQLTKLEIKSKRRQILCHNGLFTDIALGSKECYEVIYYKNQIIFANTERRENQNDLFSYIGLKFEHYLARSEEKVDDGHFKLLLKGQYGDFPFLSVVEVDGATEKWIEPTNNTEQMNALNNYVEVKLTLVHDFPTIEKLNKIVSPSEVLTYVEKNVKFFDKKLEKWLYQCWFGRQDTLIIGTRDQSFKILFVKQLHINDLIQYIKKNKLRMYERFTSSIEKIEKVLTMVDDYVLKNSQAKEKENVFLLKLGSRPLIEKTSPEKANSLFDISITKEFQDWREKT